MMATIDRFFSRLLKTKWGIAGLIAFFIGMYALGLASFSEAVNAPERAAKAECEASGGYAWVEKSWHQSYCAADAQGTRFVLPSERFK